MFKQLFGSRPTTKWDVYLAAGAAAMALIKAIDVHNQYKKEHSINENKENEK